VHDAVSNGRQDFLLVDVRSPDLYANGHALGAVNIPHRKLIESLLGRYSRETMFVVYCAGPHCNGAHRAAVRLARLGRPVKIMIGGMTGWLDEGFRTESGARLTQLFPDDELQARPGLVDGAHFDVDEAERERDLAHGVFGDVGLRASRTSSARKSRSPRPAASSTRGAQILVHAGARCLEEVRDVRSVDLAHSLHASGAARATRRSDRGGDDEDRRAGLDSELLRQRRARIAGHVLTASF
jgi:rhodanese-related sulfurtransferase